MNIIQLIKDVFLPKQEEKEAGLPGELPAGKIEYSKLIEDMVSSAGYRDYTPMGSPEAVCPSCGSELENFPPRKIQCPSCNKDIFVRTRGSDKQKVLLKSDELDEFEARRIFDSGRYDRRITKLIEDMERYASGSGGWLFLSALKDNDSLEFVELHGRVIKSGSTEETEALKLLIRPDSRARTKTWFNDPEKDADPGEYEQQKKEWFDNHK